jgi:hypothetical protein
MFAAFEKESGGTVKINTVDHNTFLVIALGFIVNYLIQTFKREAWR